MAKPEKKTGDEKHILKEQKAFKPYLLQAQKNNVPLTINIKDHSEKFSSSILGIYPENGILALDELMPRHGHKLFLEKKQLVARAFLDGAQLRFSTSLVGEGKTKSGIVFYKVKMPESVYYHQQRESFRVTLKGTNIPIQAHYGEEGQVLTGYVGDMSMGGMGLVLEQPVTLELGESLKSCIVTLPGEGDINFSLVIRFTQINEQQKNTRVGGQFKDVSSEDGDKLRKAIVDLQREQVRRQRGI